MSDRPGPRIRAVPAVTRAIAILRLLSRNHTPLGLKAIAQSLGLVPSTTLHILRHSFCSHLAMRGAPARAIQELAGHQDLGTTQRYMHLSPAALDVAIRLLETGTETGGAAVEK